MKNEYQSVYSMKIMQNLVSQGFFPVKTLPNPLNSKYKYWVFKRSEEFDIVFTKLLTSLTNSKSGGNENGSQ